ncbi:Phosphate-starvation-inducible protein PsiE OS=Ureibacillus acetophenoni OX=614649 GN=SAMN05877842_11149 PE=4 SV=1 [Ureibacillus acetophenoni]|uniref:phosphate-starvation-inducible protein PsiE n=1 Tax=Ureibacillus sp. MALMAid1270 TaxID=3411629 RepID=UPI003BA637CC
MGSKVQKVDAKIVPERLEEALVERDRLIMQIIISVLDEKQILERHILKERVANLIELSKHDDDLKETIHALINKI